MPKSPLLPKEIQLNIRMRMEQAKEHVGKQEFNEAILAIRLAQQQIQELETIQDVSELKRTLLTVEQNYRELLARKEAQASYMAAMRLVEEADNDVARLDYAAGQAKLTSVRETWPAKFYGRELEEVTARQQRIATLLQEQGKALGEARNVVSKALAWNLPDISFTKLNELSPHLRTLRTQGEMTATVKYNDQELWLRMRVLLDRLSHDLATKAQECLQQYDQSNSPVERRKIYEEHEKYYQCSRLIDDWLQNLK